MSPTTKRHRALTASEWGVLALLTTSVFINYIDRGSLSIAAPVLTKELVLRPQELGLLLSAFFWTYATFMLVAGWLVDRYPVRWVMGLGFLLWSGATALTGFVNGLPMLILLRVILGAGEAVAYPAYSKIIVSGFAEERRGLVNSLIDAGSKAGPALGIVVGGLVVDQMGWRALFYVLGFGGLLWLIPWFIWAPHSESSSHHASSGPGFLRILKERSAWGTMICLFCANYAWYFILTWLPTYLVNERGFSMKEMATLGSLPLWVLAGSTSICGYVSDHLIAGGGSPTRVRKGFAAGGLFFSMVFLMPAALVTEPKLSIVFLMLTSAAFGMTTSNLWAITQTIAGPFAAGKWTGVQNGFGNLAGVVAPYLTGLIVQQTSSYYLAFVTVAVLLVCGSASYLFVVGPVSRTDWDARKR